MVLASKDSVGCLWILAIHAIDISAKGERKGGREEEKREQGVRWGEGKKEVGEETD